MSDPPTDRSALLLEGILQTLKQINDKISIQERRWDGRDEGLENFTALPSRLGEPRTAENKLDHGGSVVAQRLQPTPSDKTPNRDAGASRLTPLEAEEEDNSSTDCRSWRSRLEDSPLHQHSFLTDELGDAWTIPDDGRLPLSFSREVLEGLSPDQLRTTVSYISKFRDRMARSNDLRFHVIDYDTFLGKNIVYRLGQPAAYGKQDYRPKPMISPIGDAPRRRFV